MNPCPLHCYAVSLAILVVGTACSPSATRAPASAAVARIQTALPTVDEPFADPPGKDAHSQGWAALMTQRAQSPGQLDAVAAVLQAPVAVANVIEEAFNDGVDGRVALATCKGHNPIIYYSASDIAQFDARSVSFVRHHEIAHHQLGQVDCSGAQPRFPGYDEKAADCAAIDALRPEGLQGRDVVMSIAAVFYYMNKPAVSPYPSTRDRAAYLTAGCGHRLPDS